MARRLIPLLVPVALLAASCTYESSGTTTTTTVAVEDLPPSTGPADIVIEDQRIEGTAVEIESVTLPSDGWVVVRQDVNGAPGEIIGISEILRQGVIARVPIPFFVPITDDTIVHASIHIDMDRNGVFTYEAPDALIDEIATFANGSVATATANVDLLPPLQPAEVVIEDQQIDGTVVGGVSAVLPAQGFVALMGVDDAGEPGGFLDVTNRLEPGDYEDLEFTPIPALREPSMVWAVVWIDRDEDGNLDPSADAMGVRADGTIAQASALMQVVLVEPSSIDGVDQESEGGSISVGEVVLPSAGFVELLTDDGGPGELIAVSALRVAGTYEDVLFEFDEPLEIGEAGLTLWVRVLIDFDEDGEPSEIDRFGLAEIGGEVAQDSFTVTLPEEEP